MSTPARGVRGRGRGGGRPPGDDWPQSGSAQQLRASQHPFSSPPEVFTTSAFSMFGQWNDGSSDVSPATVVPPPKRKQDKDDDEAHERSVMRLSYDYNNVISVLVGPEEEAFIVHEHFICAKSKFFEAACRKEWLEGAQKLVRLPEVEPKIFKSYLNWVYSGDLVVDASKADAGGESPKEMENCDFIKLYVLGDTLDDLSLRNSAIGKLIQIVIKSDYQLGHKSATWAFEHTPIESPLRKMIVRVAIMQWDRTDFATNKAKYHPEFVQDLAVSLMHQTDKERTSSAAFSSKMSNFIEEQSKA